MSSLSLRRILFKDLTNKGSLSNTSCSYSPLKKRDDCKPSALHVGVGTRANCAHLTRKAHPAQAMLVEPERLEQLHPHLPRHRGHTFLLRGDRLLLLHASRSSPSYGAVESGLLGSAAFLLIRLCKLVNNSLCTPSAPRSWRDSRKMTRKSVKESFGPPSYCQCEKASVLRRESAPKWAGMA